ncbi:MAG TPA: OB-fold nucleic acid binding domain-containing protein, partial [Burkholderiales bacterium]|nr:OB-fold nucleic acid binding domain-containing protein [Burkholderiales bacterium]
AAARPFVSVHELHLGRRNLRCLAAAGALRSVAGHRRLAYWAAAGAGGRSPLDVPAGEPLPRLEAPREGEEIAADYASLGLTLGRHPLALLRKRLSKRKLIDSRTLNRLPDGSFARLVGLVTCRQRPDTASGVVFVTVEDEAGCVNVVVWRDLVESQKRELLDARLLGVMGRVEREGEVVHLVARRLHDYTPMLGSLMTASRDFH